MAVTNVMAFLLNPVKDPPIRSPLHGLTEPITQRAVLRSEPANVQTIIAESRPWAGWFGSLSGVKSQIIITADVDFGTVLAGLDRTEVIPGGAPNIPVPITPLPNVNSFVLVNPSSGDGAARGLLFFANMTAALKILVRAVNYRTTDITAGVISLRFWIIPPADQIT